MEILKKNKQALTIEFLGALIFTVLSGVALTWQNYAYYGSNQCAFINARDLMLMMGPFAAVMTFLAYNTSGAHFNPIITLGTTLVGKTPILRGTLFFVVQVWGYAIGGLVLTQIIPFQRVVRFGRAEFEKGQRVLPIPKGLEFYTDANDRDNAFSIGLLGSEAISGMILFFGYFLGSNMKKLTNRGMATVMGLSYMISVGASAPTTGGIANPIFILGNLFMRQAGLGSILFADNVAWVLLAGPAAAAIISALAFPLIFTLTSPFSTKQGSHVAHNPEGTVEERLVPESSD